MKGPIQPRTVEAGGAGLLEREVLVIVHSFLGVI